MEVTFNVPGVIYYMVLGWHPPADQAIVIGLSTVAYLSEKDPGHIFLPAARKHDAFYSDPEAQKEFSRWRADQELLFDCLTIAKEDVSLATEAVTLYLFVRKMYSGKAWSGPQ